MNVDGVESNLQRVRDNIVEITKNGAANVKAVIDANEYG